MARRTADEILFDLEADGLIRIIDSYEEPAWLAAWGDALADHQIPDTAYWMACAGTTFDAPWMEEA